MVYPAAPCPVCGARPLRHVGGECVRCPRECLLREPGVAYLRSLSGGRRTELSEQVRKLSLEDWVFPIFLGFIVEGDKPPLLVCVAQTGKDCLELLKRDFDTRKCEVAIVEMIACRAENQKKGAA